MMQRFSLSLLETMWTQALKVRPKLQKHLNPLTFCPQFDGSQCQSEILFVWHQVQNFVSHTTT